MHSSQFTGRGRWWLWCSELLMILVRKTVPRKADSNVEYLFAPSRAEKRNVIYIYISFFFQFCNVSDSQYLWYLALSLMLLLVQRTPPSLWDRFKECDFYELFYSDLNEMKNMELHQIENFTNFLLIKNFYYHIAYAFMLKFSNQSGFKSWWPIWIVTEETG